MGLAPGEEEPGPGRAGYLSRASAAARSPRNPPRAAGSPPLSSQVRLSQPSSKSYLSRDRSPASGRASGAAAPAAGRCGRPARADSTLVQHAASLVDAEGRCSPPSSPVVGRRPATLCQGGVLPHGLCASPLAPHGRDLMGDKCRDYRGCVRRSGRGRRPGGREAGTSEGGRTERRHSYKTGTETPASPRQADRRRWGQGQDEEETDQRQEKTEQ